jgi:light-regulated signal transduction histidine kinase (bacteriophytochrome)
MTDTRHMSLEACEREPIHVPGFNEPHGLLLVVDPTSEVVLQSAGDAASLLGYGGSLIGTSLRLVLKASLSDLLQQTGTAMMEEPTYIGWIRPKSDESELTISAHRISRRAD